MSYSAFIQRKSQVIAFDGITSVDLNSSMFPHQRDLVRWALAKGRAALFADTGMGKSLMALEWARHVATRGRVIILTPLAVAKQFVREGAKFGIEAAYLRADDGVTRIVITNYEMLDHFDTRNFVGVVIDESSILKAFDGRTRNEIIQRFGATPYRLACTATPAPNDFAELGNHAEFLGVQSRSEMLAEYFVHDGETTQEWRLKGHAQALFWKWVASWAAIIQKPSDFGYDDAGYALPPLRMEEHVIQVEADEVVTLSQQRANRRSTMAQRVDMAASIIARGPAEPFVVWCELNDEADAIEAAIPGAVQVKGAQSPEEKATRLEAFTSGQIRVLVSKTSICGFGLNWQHCSKTIFVGASHSFEQTYQAIRRFWRFGQAQPVEVNIIRASNEGAIIANYRRKEADAARMAVEMKSFSRDAVMAEISAPTRREWNVYAAHRRPTIPNWLVSDYMERAA